MIAGKRIEEIPIPTYYGDEICRVDGLKYAFDVVKASLQAWFQKLNLFYDRRFDCAPARGWPALSLEARFRKHPFARD